MRSALWLAVVSQLAGCSAFVDLDGVRPAARDGGDHDGPPQACSHGARTCVGPVLHECQGDQLVELETCAYRCSADGGAHCAPFVPSNLSGDGDFSTQAPMLFVNTGVTATADTDGGTVLIGGAPLAGVVTRVVTTDPDGAALVHPLRVFSFSSIEVRGTLTLAGTNLGVLVVSGPVAVTGTLRAAAVSNACVPGASIAGDTSAGNSGGGGGGGFASAGGAGGMDCTSCSPSGQAAGGAAGPAVSGVALVPLRPGCDGGGAGTAGGAGEDPSAGLGGAGGGGLQIAATGEVSISGKICVAGDGGRGGAYWNWGASQVAMGGGGGGSGGSLLIEAAGITVTGAGRLSAAGGNGASGSAATTSTQAADGCTLPPSTTCSGNRGAAGTSTTHTGCNGNPDSNGSSGGGGGGGGLGVIGLRATGSITVPSGGAIGLVTQGALP